MCVSMRAMQSEKKNSNSGKCSYKLGKGKTGSFSPPFSGTGATKINIDGATTKHALGQVNKNPAARLSSILFCAVAAKHGSHIQHTGKKENPKPKKPDHQCVGGVFLYRRCVGRGSCLSNVISIDHQASL